MIHNAYFEIFGSSSGAPNFMCLPEVIDHQIALCDEDELQELIHLCSIISSEWEEAIEIYNLMWNQFAHYEEL